MAAAVRLRGLRGDPITLTLGAAHLGLSRAAGEVFLNQSKNTAMPISSSVTKMMPASVAWVKPDHIRWRSAR
jgi:hypothetical protein